MDKFDAMQLFVRVVEKGSFSAVAKERGIGQPAVSKQISALEDELGIELIHRPSEASPSLARAGRHQRCRKLHGPSCGIGPIPDGRHLTEFAAAYRGGEAVAVGMDALETTATRCYGPPRLHTRTVPIAHEEQLQDAAKRLTRIPEAPCDIDVIRDGLCGPFAALLKEASGD
jgi:hypothetical protein